MVERVLIANRGEIALRIQRACRELEIGVVAAHTRVDEGLLHLRHADDTVCIGEHSYREGNDLIAAALSRDCDAIHPGYGMLSENAEFARQVKDAGLRFIGPAPEVVETMGDKARARKTVEGLGLTAVPGSEEVVSSVGEAKEIATAIGYPVLVKAAFGGGGRGMRVVSDERQLADAFTEAQEEARAIFGDPGVYIEKYFDHARHVEVQVMGDGKGSAVHLGTRECSVQRRYQKIIEEAPVPGLQLEALAQASAKAAADLRYESAGTFEFLYQDGTSYFIEMNTRIQVEHPVTEAITGLDIVRMQLEIARDGRLPIGQEDVVQRGHAIECRVNAELMENGGVTASPGLAYDYVAPGGPGVRVDSHLYNGYKVPHHYDSLIAKIICWGAGREEALARMSGALMEFEIRGIDTNTAILKDVVASEAFVRGDLDTHMLERMG